MSLRYELKFRAPPSLLPQLRALLLLHPEAFRVQHVPRQVNSLYFDTPVFDCYRANLLGDRNRQKLRLRWYGEQHASVTARLELKRKHNMLGDKELWLLPQPVALDRGWRQLRQSLAAQSPEAWQIALGEASEAATVTQYWREYYVSADGQIRATLDYRQRSFDQRGYMRPNLRHPLLLPDTLVVEVKADPRQSARLERFAGTFPVRRARNSKYVNSISAMPA